MELNTWVKISAGGVLCCSLLVSPTVAADTARLQVTAEPTTLHIQSTVDDTHLRDPTGYEPGAAHGHFMDRLVITNRSSAAVSSFRLDVNGGNTLNTGRVKLDTPSDLFATFNAWSSAVHHAPTHHGFANHAASLVNFIGHGLCGHNANALIGLLAGAGLPYRVAPVNGHGLAEYLVGGSYRLIDGDQDAVFFDWNNTELVGYEDLRADPLLAIRTRMFGVNHSYNLETSWINASVFEFVRETGNADMELVPSLPEWARQGWDLLPGEQLEYRFREGPPAAQPDIGTVVLTLETPPRLSEEGVLALKTPLPVFRIELNGQVVAVPGLAKDLAVDVRMKVSPADRVRLFMQGSVRQFPHLRRGENKLQLTGAGEHARLDVEAHYHSSNRALPAATVKAGAAGLRISATDAPVLEAPDRLWWQVSGDERFEIIAPNLNQVQAYETAVDWHPMTKSFLNADQPYFARVRISANGLWGDWSEAVAFDVSKPDRPRDIAYELSDGKVVLTWQGDPDVNWLVFGSNRIDFVPEVYSSQQIVLSEDKQVSRVEPNDNLLGKVSDMRFVDDAPKAFYRIIASKEGRLSVPSNLLHVGELRGQATVLQMRWEKVQIGPGELDYRDVYVASEHALSNSDP